jgi:hypothetical protein
MLHLCGWKISRYNSLMECESADHCPLQSLIAQASSLETIVVKSISLKILDARKSNHLEHIKCAAAVPSIDVQGCKVLRELTVTNWAAGQDIKGDRPTVNICGCKLLSVQTLDDLSQWATVNAF